MDRQADSTKLEQDRKRACEDKLPYKTFEEAEAAAVYARWQYGEDGAGLVPYKCRYCERYHLARN